MKKRFRRTGAVVIALTAVLAVALGAYLVVGGNQLTVARCVVTDSGTVYMVYGGRPVQLTSLGGYASRYRTGDTLLILHANAFADSYPEQVRTTVAVRIGRGSRADIPASVIGTLTEPGNRIP